MPARAGIFFSGRLAVEVAVDDVHVEIPPGEAAGELFRDGDGAVAAAGAADPDREVRLALRLVARDQEVQQAPEALHEGAAVLVLEDLLRDHALHAGALLQ